MEMVLLTEIVSVCIVVKETKENIMWYLQKVKDKHPKACNGIKSFMADKDFSARRNLKEMLHVPVYIYVFHTAKIFNRMITHANMDIEDDEREKDLQILQKMIYAAKEEKYIYKGKE